VVELSRFGLAVALVAAFVTGNALPAAAAPAEGLEAVIVVLAGAPDDSDAAARDIAHAHGARLGFVYRHALRGFSAQVPAARLGALARDPRVAWVELDQRVHVFQQSLPTGIDRSEADRSPLTGIGGSVTNVDLAVLDTGIDLDHPDLNVYRATDCTKSVLFAYCTGSSTNLDDQHGHGTHVAGIAAALDNDFGAVGVSPGARLWSVKVLDNNGSGYLSWIIAGIDIVTQYASEIEVANVSLGAEFQSASLDQAISNSVDAGVVYAVAAGNSSKDASSFSPASHPDVITTSAMADFDGQAGGAGTATCRADQDDTLADFSNYGPLVEIAAPGVCIYSTWKDGGYHTISGTSMASPHVAGAAALYLAHYGRDTNGDGLVDRTDVLNLRAILVGAALPQTDQCGYTNEHAAQGSTEPLLFVNATSLGGDGSCQRAAQGDTPPMVEITAPTEGATVSGQVAITASAGDDAGVAQVEFFAGGTSLGVDQDGSDGWSASWNTTEDGPYTITAIATDTAGQTASHSITVTVDNFNDPPAAAFTYACSGLECSFDGTGSSDPDGTIASFTWDFGDGGTASGSAAGHPYSTAGTYKVTLTVTDERGAADTESKAVTVSPATHHVGDLDGETYKLTRGRWAASVSILVHDAQDAPLEGATVTGVFTLSDGSTITRNCTTLSGSGACFVESGPLARRVSSVTFTVTAVSHDSSSYASAANHDPDGDSDGTSITVVKP
jgi:subtilisin family serine protease